MKICPKDNLTIQKDMPRLLPFKIYIRDFERFLDGKQTIYETPVIYGLITQDWVHTLHNLQEYKNMKELKVFVSSDKSFPIMKRYCKNYKIPETNPHEEIECMVTVSDIIDQVHTPTEFVWDLYVEFDSISDLAKFKLTA